MGYPQTTNKRMKLYVISNSKHVNTLCTIINGLSIPTNNTIKTIQNMITTNITKVLLYVSEAQTDTELKEKFINHQTFSVEQYLV
jgi:hypothetical protein